MKKQVLIIGLGRFGVSLATTFFNTGHDVLVIDIDEKRVQAVASQVTQAIRADATDEAVLKELGVSNFDVAIVTMGRSIQNNVLATLLLKELGVRYVIARAENDLHGSILAKIGADKVVYPEQETGTRVAHGVFLGSVKDYISLAPGYGIFKLDARPSFVEQSLSELGLGRGGGAGLSVLLIMRGKDVIVTPDKSESIKEGDIMIVAGNDDRLEQFMARHEKDNRGKEKD